MDAKACYAKCVEIVGSMHKWPPHLVWSMRKDALGPDEQIIWSFVNFHSNKKMPLAAFPGISEAVKKDLWNLLLKNDWATSVRSKLYPNTGERTKVCFGLVVSMSTWPAHILEPLKKAPLGTDTQIINGFVDYMSTKNFAAQFPGISDSEKKELKQTLEKFKFGAAYRDQLAAISSGRNNMNQAIAKHAAGWVSDQIKENVVVPMAEELAREMALAAGGSAAAGELAAAGAAAAVACVIQ